MEVRISNMTIVASNCSPKYLNKAISVLKLPQKTIFVLSQTLSFFVLHKTVAIAFSNSILNLPSPSPPQKKKNNNNRSKFKVFFVLDENLTLQTQDW